MSKIEIRGWEIGRPIASVIDSDFNKPVHLGVHEIAGHRLPPFLGVDLDLARAEAVPLDAHNAFEDYWSREGSLHTLDIAILGLLTNILSPFSRKPPHLEIFQEFGKAISTSTADTSYQARRASNLVQIDIDRNPHHYTMDSRDRYLESLELLSHMLAVPNRSPREFRISANGDLTLKS